MLLDTSGLLCLVLESESFHARAVEAYDEGEIRLVHSYILAEFIALANVRGVPRQIALKSCSDFQDDSEIEMVWVDEALHREALELLMQRLDKRYSLCDAVSFVLLRRYQIVDALTTDQHFEQEGFRRLLV